MKLQDVALKLNSKFENNAYRGYVDGYEFQITSVKNGFFNQYYLSFLLESPLSTEDFKKIKETAGRLNIIVSDVVKKQNMLSIFINKTEKTLERAKKIVSYFKRNEIRLLDSEIYDADFEITAYKNITVNFGRTILQHQVTIPVHDAVYNDRIEQQISKIEEDEAGNKHLLPGLLLAFLGAIVGTIPSVIVYFMGYMVWFLYFIVPFASFYGYKLAKGPQKRWLPAVIGIISVVTSVLIFLLLWANVASSVDLSLAELLDFEEIFMDFLRDGLFLLAGNIVGVIVSYKYLYNKTSSGQIEQLRKMK